MDISHEEFVTIFREKDKDEKMKEHLRSENEECKTMGLSSIKSMLYKKTKNKGKNKNNIK